MKKILLSLVAITTMALSSFGQAPDGFKYQAVVRDAGNLILNNQAVGVQLTIQQGSVGGTAVYTETFAPTTNAYGLVNLEIGSGTTTDDFSLIDWANGPYFIETAIDVAGGTSYAVMGTSQLMSVPYALHAATAGSVANDQVDDADADPLNELNTGIVLNGTDLETTDAGGTIVTDLSSLQDGVNDADADPTNELQDWSTLPGIPADILDGDQVNDADADPANEIQDLSLSGNSLGLSGSTPTVDLSTYLDNTDAQTLSITGSDLTITGGNTVTLPSGGLTGSGTADYMTKFTGATVVGNSLMRDDGTSTAINAIPSPNYMLYAYQQQLTADGDGQATVYGYRTRDSQNDGVSYATTGGNSAVRGYNYWGDIYTFGVVGTSYNDYTRTGGVMGAQTSGTYWGSLGYKNSASATYGVYGSSGYASGAGLLPSTEAIGIGGGFFGNLIGSTSKGAVIGQLNSGELFAQYNQGNVYTLGKNIELVKVNETVTPVYSVSSIEATIYAKGTVQLENGSAYIEFSDEYKTMLGETPVITATPNGECNGVYIASIDKNGFTVKELMSGSSNATISWISVGNRIDNDKMELATQIVSDPSFNRNIEQVLFSDGNIEGSASGMWWNGSEIKFGEIPAHLTKVDRSEAEEK
jgi:hypothetical protein